MINPKKVLILTADAGYGHRSAANAIAAALDQRYGADVQAVIVNPLNEPGAPGWLRRQQTDYDKIIQQMPDLYRFGYQTSDASVPTAIIENALTIVLFEVMREVIKRHEPDAVVITYPFYQAPLWAYFTVSRRATPVLTVVTDLATVHRLWFHQVAHTLLAPTEPVQKLAIASGLDPERVVVTGIPVNPGLSQPGFSRIELRSELGWDLERTTVLVVGSKRVRTLDEVLRVINHSALPLQLVLIAGGDEALLERFRRTDWHLPVHKYGFVNNMPDFMRAADVLLCKAGGLIVTEGLAAGLPLLLVDVLEGQETGNAEYVLSGGAGDLARSPVEALETLYHWLDHGRALMYERASNALKLGKPKAAFDAAELVWQAAGRGPDVRPRRGVLSRKRLMALLREHGILD